MKNRLQKITSGICVTAAMFAASVLVSCGGSSNTIVCGTEAQFPPFEFKDESGKITGFDMELIEAVAAKMGKEIKIQDMGFAGLIPALQSGQIQMIAAAMSVTEERKQSVLFSTPYIDAGLSLVVRADDSVITGDSTLTGKTVAVQQGSTGAKTADEFKAAGKLAEVKYFPNVGLAMMELAKGGVDAVINDTPSSEAYLKKEVGKVKILPDKLATDSYALAFNLKSTELQAAVNKALAELTADGTIEKLKVKYFGS